MRAALCKSLDGPDGIVVEIVPPAVAGAGEVVISVSAVAMNFFDTLVTRGKYQHKPALPFSPGGEVAGRITSVGPGVKGLFPGDRVMAYLGIGGARDEVAARAETVVKLPDGVADDVASGLAITYGTAIHGLKDRGALQPGETVVVLGAAGGAGLAAVEVAKLMGARVIAVASNAEKLAVAKAHGADETVDYGTHDLKTKLRDLTAGQGADVVYDCVGGAQAEPALRALAWGGRYLVVGFASGEIPKLPLNLLLVKGVSAVGVFWGDSVKRNPAGHIANMEQVLAWIAAGQLRPRIHARLPLTEVADAIRMLDRREAIGKIIVVP